MSKLDQKVARLAAMFLNEYSERLGNDGCNDFRWPSWIGEGVREEIMRHHPDADRDPDMVERACRRDTANFLVVDAVAAMLGKMAAS